VIGPVVRPGARRSCELVGAWPASSSPPSGSWPSMTSVPHTSSSWRRHRTARWPLASARASHSRSLLAGMTRGSRGGSAAVVGARRRRLTALSPVPGAREAAALDLWADRVSIAAFDFESSRTRACLTSRRAMISPARRRSAGPRPMRRSATCRRASRLRGTRRFHQVADWLQVRDGPQIPDRIGVAFRAVQARLAHRRMLMHG
jgi:hypothetical protein